MPETSLVGRKVLIIEDESLLAMLLEDFLVRIGCEVAGAASRFNDAMEKARSLTFDVAILDVNLNGQKSYPIAEALAARDAPFIFATGYGLACPPPSLRGAPLLQKPFKECDLERALRQAVAAKPEPT